MSWGVATTVGIDLSISSYVTFNKGGASADAENNLLQETGFNILQENGGLIILDQ